MPLPILLALVIGGIGGIAILLHLTGHTTRVDLRDPQVARAAWIRAYPDTPMEIHLPSPDGRAALVETPEGPGLLWAMGADTCARLLANEARAEIGSDRITFTFADPGMPTLALALAPEAQAAWTPHLEALSA